MKKKIEFKFRVTNFHKQNFAGLHKFLIAMLTSSTSHSSYFCWKVFMLGLLLGSVSIPDRRRFFCYKSTVS